ncbi:MAG: hypothetical protein IJQ67_04655 [Bacilli bacterium]|nr:hypothetical protein [Bacilli bacterium]
MKNSKLLIIFSAMILALTGCNKGGKTSDSSESKPASEESSIVDSSEEESIPGSEEESIPAPVSEESEEESLPAESEEESLPAESEEESFTSEESTISESHTYNIILTAATVPPVVSALESIVNGYPTYAFIERGKTYSGIALLEDANFYNLGFDATTNESSGVTLAAFKALTDKVVELKTADAEAKFNLFTTDYKPWSAVKVASDANLLLDDFTVYMVEDGTATYSYGKKYFVTPFATNDAADAFFDERLAAADNLLAAAMEDSSVLNEGNKKNGYVEGYKETFVLSTHDNFIHVMQDKTKMQAALKDIEGSKLYDNYINDGANVVYKSISERVRDLTEEQKDNYLNLMFGDFKAESYRLLTRTVNDTTEDPMPAKKLIYIGTRARQSGKGLIPTQTFTSLGASIADLPLALREFFLNQDDYDLVYNYLNDEANYEEAWKDNADVVAAVKNAAFNMYIGFAYNLKITQRLYGDEYDVLFKGHPAETFESPESWKGYEVTVSETKYTYNSFMYKLALKFHTDDSEGKFIGVLPGGVAAENLAYLGVDTYVGGLPSSTYTGYDKASPILFVLNTIEDDIHADGNINQRYLDGELVWEDDGKTIETQFMNKFLTYQILSNLYKEHASTLSDTEKGIYEDIADAYITKLNAGVKSYLGVDTDVEVTKEFDIDNNGSIVINDTEELLPEVRRSRLATVDAIMEGVDLSLYSDANKDVIRGLVATAKANINELTNPYLMNAEVTNLRDEIAKVKTIEQEQQELTSESL